jgi:Fic family protein
MNYLEDFIEIDKVQEQIAAYGKFSVDQLNQINFQFKLNWNYYSNRMEGNTLTISETRAVMANNLQVRNKTFKEVAEMNQHNRAIEEAIKIGKSELKLSEKRIKEIHQAIMYEDDENLKSQIGQWKQINNQIINSKGEKFDFTNYRDVPDAIHTLLNNTNSDIDKITTTNKLAKHPIQVALDFHIDFLTIHPFYDGNGRTARILSNLILISFGYPPFWITDENKAKYYLQLTNIQGYGFPREDFYMLVCEFIRDAQNVILEVVNGKN